MAAPQGLAYFPGIQFIESADIPFSALGVSPSVFSIRITPQAGNIRYQGDLTLTFGGQTVARFVDCMVDSASVEIGKGGRIIALKLLDRRWKWVEFGEISGEYNTRDLGGNVKFNEKSPRDLAALCLKAMGETGFDVSDLPNDTRPEVKWDFDNPARALNNLVTGLGCVVVLQQNNRVAIRRVGRGAGNRFVSLPFGPVTPQYSSGIDPDDEPDAHVVVCGRNRYQVDLELEAVGLESDGSIRPDGTINLDGTIRTIDNLSYKPSGGWENVADIENFSEISDEDLRKLARRTVFRWYRIKTPFWVPGLQEFVTSIDQIAPIENEQVMQEIIGGQRVNKAAEAFGVWFRPGSLTQNNANETLEVLTSANLCDVNFAIDADLGIVKFSEPVVRIVDDKPYAALLGLRVAIGVRDFTTRAWKRFTKEKKKTSGFRLGTKPKHLMHDELVTWYIPDYINQPSYPRFHTQVTFATNQRSIEDECDKLIAHERQQYIVRDPETAVYAGWFLVQVDGSIQAVNYSVGTSGAFMTVHRNQDRGGDGSISFQQRQQIAKNRIAQDHLWRLLANQNNGQSAKGSGAAGILSGPD